MEIRLPNEKILNISINLNEDIKKNVENLCKIYSLNESKKEKLINILLYILLYFLILI